jgi:type IV pilus assembly protein PilA
VQLVKRFRTGFTLIELMIVVAIIGLLAALAIPNFLKFQARSKQSEARSNLKSYFTAERSYYADKQMFLDVAGPIGFGPESANRYGYFLGAAGAQEVRACAANVVCAAALSTACPTAPAGCEQIEADEKWNSCAPMGYAPGPFTGLVVGPSGQGPNTAVGIAQTGTCCPSGNCEFAAEAIANIDNDTTLDAWVESSETTVAAGLNVTCGVGTTGTASEGEPINLCNDVQN